MIPAGFHFLRPDWLYALIPAVLLALLVWRRLGQGRDDWAGLVDAHLLRHLAVRERAGMRRWPVPALLAAWALAVVALAGPAWQKVPTPTLDRLDPVVVVLSLSRSMDGTDRKPSRLVAARHKVEDMLGRMKGGQVGLVIYAEAPFVAAPLTEDARVVGQMLPELATDLMPVPGDRPDLGIAEAVKLLKNTGAPTGRIVLVADGPGQNPPLTRAAVTAASAAGYTVSVLDVTAPGGDDAAQGALRTLASDGRGRFAAVSPDGRDLDAVLARSLAARSPVAEARSPLQESGLKADQWVDMGPWLLLLAAPLAALAFRRGWLAALPLAFLLGGALSGEARAQALEAPDAAALQRADSTWRNLWQTPDQQGASAFSRKDYDTAARSFADPAWKGSALYEGGNYDAAASTFSATPGADYNRGNALAKAGKLEEAVSAYEAALARDPKDADAQHNLDIVKKVLELRKQQQDEQNKQNQQNQKDQQDQKDQQKQGGGGQSQSKDKSSDGKDKKQDPGQDKGQDKGQDPKPDPGDKPQPEQPGPEKGQNKGPNKEPGKDQKDQKKPDQGQDKGQDKGQGQGQDKPDPSKPDPSKPGDNNKPDPSKPGDNNKPDPKKPGEDKAPPPDKPGQDQPDPFAPPPPPNQKPEPPQPAPQPQPSPQGQPQPAQPAPAPEPKPGPGQPGQGQPGQGQPGQGQQAQPVQVKPGEPPKEPPKDPKTILMPRPMTEQDQNREQALRSVPDDPVGLLRARIRSYYSGAPVPAYEEKGP